MGMRLRCLAGLVSLVGLGLLVSCYKSTSSSSNPGTGVLYLTTQGDSLLSTFSVDLSSGAVTAAGTPAATGDTPTAMIISPDGSSIFVANSGGGSNAGCGSAGAACLTAYTVNSDGSVSASGSPITAGSNPRGLAMDSAGKFLFVADQGLPPTSALPAGVPGSVLVFSVSGTTLTPVAQSGSLIFGSNPAAVAVTPDGKYLYVANQVDGTVSQFTVDGTGVLTQPGNSLYTVGTTPTALAVTADGNFLYVANQGSNNISAFIVCDNASPSCVVPDGSLTAATNSPFPAGTRPVSIVEDPSATFLYVADRGSNQVSQFKISVGTGALTPLSPATVSVGSNPVWVAAHFGNTQSTVTTDFVFVPNIGASSISTFSYDTTTGTLTVVGSPLTVGGQPSAIVLR